MMMGSSSLPSLQMSGGMGGGMGMSMDAYGGDPRHHALMMHSKLDALEHEVQKVKMHQASQQLMPLGMPMGAPMAPMGMAPMGQMGAAAGSMQLQPAADQPSSGRRAAHKELMSAHKELVDMMKKQSEQHAALMKAHKDLMKANKGGKGKGEKKQKVNPALGVVRLDYNYPPAAGDIDSPASFGYDVYYRVCPGLTFEMAQNGRFTEEVERNFAEAIKYLEARGVCAMTGDCGFMMAFQVKARQIATKPIFMSSMVQCPIIAAAFDPGDQILVLTANGNSLRPQKEVLMNSCGFDVNEDRFVIVGCQDVPGFDAVAKGEAVPLEVVQPGIVKKVKATIKAKPAIRAILMECTELPPYSDACRAATGLPVWDAITGADFYVNAYKDNPRFGINDWQEDWDEEQEEYNYGDNLIQKDKDELLNKVGGAQPKKKPSKKQVEKLKKKLAKKQAPCLGVVRLDYNYPPAAGDIDCPGSYGYDVLFRVIPGLTFEMAQAGRMTPAVERSFRAGIQWLEKKGAVGITGDCGFMMAFQPIARDVATVPVFMSSMVQSPMISVAFDKYDKVVILTANSATLKPQKEILLSQCGFNVDDDRFLIVGCQDVPGFDAVAKGGKVDVEYVTPGIVKLVKDLLKRQPTIRAILLECTELPPYSDALRQATGLPVWDAITNADFFISASQDNPRFGLNDWQNPWDGEADEYVWGENLSAAQKAKCLNF
jgi:hypothetical protein